MSLKLKKEGRGERENNIKETICLLKLQQQKLLISVKMCGDFILPLQYRDGKIEHESSCYMWEEGKLNNSMAFI